jgi:predicted outer membrane repeat protein
VARTVYVGDTATDSKCDYDDIQAAISAAACPETIVVTNWKDYGPQHLLITDKSLTLTGSTAACGSGPVLDPGTTALADAVPARITLTGASNDDVDQAVITITGNSHVTLDNFSISGARDTSYTTNDGGGIVFLDYGSLTLNNVELWQNYASRGGGIAMTANGGHADLVIGANTVIHDNIAQQDGGGIYISGDVHMTMVQDQSAIYDNVARGKFQNGSDSGNGYGGGLFIAGGRADIGSPGLSNGDDSVPQNAAIARNSAAMGGGVAALSDGVHDGVAAFFTTVPSRPVSVNGNTASTYGGALLANSTYANGKHAAVCLFGARVSANRAPDAAVAIIEGASLYFNADPGGICGKSTLPALGAVDCGGMAGCNEIASNTDTGGPGDNLLRIEASDAQLDRFIMKGNQAGFGILTLSYDPQSLRLSNCLVAGNHFTAAVTDQDDTTVAIDGCTFASNTLDGNRFFTLYADANRSTKLNLSNSIVQGDGDDKTALFVGPSTLDADYNLLSDLSTVSSGTGNFTADPEFVDPTHGDYHLAANFVLGLYSPAIDYAPASDGGLDLDGHARNFDLGAVDNRYGPRDLGAYESWRACAAADTVFCNGFDPLLTETF